jgi:predicted MPP superfamily phosphohydrolase
MLKIRDGSVPVTLAHYLHQIGTGWLVFALYMALCLLFIDILKLFRVYYAYSFYIALGFVICTLLYGYLNYKHTRVNTLNLSINKPIESADKQLKVVAISDVHLGFGTDKAAFKRYVKLINQQQPDIILIAGDLIDNSVIPLRTMHIEEELAQLQAPAGIYMVSGNHEYISGIKESADYLSQTPVRLLSDSVITLPNKLQIAGRSDRSNPARLSVADLVKKADPTYPIILLDHQPAEPEQAAKAEIDLQLSGHTHNGQIWPINLLAGRLFELSYGYMQKGNTHFYTSSGLSLWGPPFRIGTVSELVVINFTFE